MPTRLAEGPEVRREEEAVYRLVSCGVDKSHSDWVCPLPVTLPAGSSGKKSHGDETFRDAFNPLDEPPRMSSVSELVYWSMMVANLSING